MQHTPDPKKGKPFFDGCPIVFSEATQKWHVIRNEQWTEWAGREEDIEYKAKKGSEEKKAVAFFRVKKSLVLKDMKGLTPVQKLIGIGIYSQYNPKVGYAWPSWKWLMEFASVSEETVRRNLPIVLTALKIKKEKFSGDNNRYFFHY